MTVIYKYCIFLFVISLTLYSQDTINFKLFDSLKTKTEDSHKINKSVSKSEITNPQDSTEGKSIKISPVNTSKIISIENLTIFRTQDSSIKYNDPDNLDCRIFRSINNSRSPLKTKVLNTFDNSMLPVAVMLSPSLFIYGRVRQKTYDENTAYLAFTSELTNFAVTFGLKTFIKRRRPLQALENVQGKQMPVLDIYSFPSGHASTTFSLATMFALRYPKYPQVYAPMYLWALIVGYGRPYFGMHYPSDVLAGALIGSGSSILIYSLRKELFSIKNNLLNESKNDDGSINGGVLTFFAGAFAISAIFDNFIFKEDPGKRFFISPWMDGKRSGVNVKWKL